MKKSIIFSVAMAVAALFQPTTLFAQTIPTQIIHFDEMADSIAPDAVIDGSKGQLKYQSNGGAFPSGLFQMNYGWDTSFGGYFGDGWAISRKNYNKVEPSDFSKHLYCASTGKGFESSEIYAIGTRNAYFEMNKSNMDSGWVLWEMQLTNSTFARNSMLFGDAFARKFNASDKDSFVLVINGFNNGQLKGTKRLVLADFRDADTTKHFILNTWKSVSFEGWMVDSVHFDMESSDNGDWGMNTPAFFALDNIVLAKPASVNKINTLPLKLYPNPSNGLVTLELPANEHPQNVKIFSISGQLMVNNEFQNTSNSVVLNASDLQSGLYLMEVISQSNQRYSSKLHISK